MNGALHFALICATKLIKPGDLVKMAPAQAVSAAECAVAYGKPKPVVVAMDIESEIPDYFAPVVVTDSEGDPSMLGVHWFDEYRGLPALRAFVDAASGFNTGRNSVSEAISHEIHEATVDAPADIWVPHPTRPGVEVALETDDPVQSSYTQKSHGTEWQMSNFVRPEWFKAPTSPTLTKLFLQHGGKFDRNGELHGPGEVGPEGYLILRARGTDGKLHVWYEMMKTGEQQLSAAELKAMLPPLKAAAFEHKLSRTRKRNAKGAREAA